MTATVLSFCTAILLTPTPLVPPAGAQFAAAAAPRARPGEAGTRTQPASDEAQSAADVIAALMDATNAQLEATGANYRVAKAEYLTTDPQGMGNIVTARDVGNRRLDTDFVPGDARQSWSAVNGTMITYAIEKTVDAVPPSGGLTAVEADTAIVRATNTWDTLRCSTLGLVRNPDFGLDIGVMAGSPFVFADVQHAGFGYFEIPDILALTYTFVFPMSDIDNDGKIDTAFRETYYAKSADWTDDGVGDIDLETVALHEIGHGLSQAHFGRVFFDRKLNLKAAPRAAMNGIYVDTQRTLLGTDRAGHCSNWAQWPRQ